MKQNIMKKRVIREIRIIENGREKWIKIDRRFYANQNNTFK